jgi:hypothetical protein
MAPQKVNHNPMKAAICKSKSIARASKVTPRAKNMPATLVEELFFFRIDPDSKLHR